MALEGNLKDFSATEILQLVASQRKTGCLIVGQGPRRRRVYVVEGRIVSTRGVEAFSDDPLYRFLRRIRRLSDDQLRGLATLHVESGRDLEDLLVQGSYVTDEELGGLIERQVLQDLTELIEWTEGAYQFDSERRWPHPVIARLSIEASVIEAARRADERKRFQELFQDRQRIVSVRDLPDPEEEISDEESELFGLIDGQHTVAETVAAAPLTDYEASEALQRMIEAGWVEFTGRREGVAEASGGGAPALRQIAPGPAPTRRPGIPIAREAAVTALCFGLLAAVWMVGRSLNAAPRSNPSRAAFTEARIRDVRVVIEVYHRESGRYPKRLDDLVQDQWLEPAQLAVDGRPLHYRLEPGGRSYALELPGPR